MVRPRKGVPVFKQEFRDDKGRVVRSVELDYEGRFVQGTNDGQYTEVDPRTPGEIAAYETGELETDQKHYNHIRYQQEAVGDPRDKNRIDEAIVRRFGDQPGLLAKAHKDPTLYMELRDEVRPLVGRSQAEKDEIERQKQRAEELEQYITSRNAAGLTVLPEELGELLELRGTKGTFRGPKPEDGEVDEAAEEQRWYDENAQQAITDRNEYRRSVLEGKKGLTTEETAELLSLREGATKPEPEGGDE